MKIIESRKRSKRSYFVRLYISDKDIEMLEDLALCEVNINDVNSLYYKWLSKTFKEFQKLWKRYDKTKN